MKPEVRDVINNINRFIQEQKYINVSSNLKVEENVVARNLQGKEDDVIAEVMENLELIFKEISNIAFQKAIFLKYKWNQRQEVEFSYLEDGSHKELNTQEITLPKLKKWEDIINSQYEFQSHWQKSIINRHRSAGKCDDRTWL